MVMFGGKNMVLRLLVMCGLLGTVSCVSLPKKDGKKEPPAVTYDMPLEEALEAALTFGEVTLDKVVRLVKARKQEAVVGERMFSMTRTSFEKWSSVRLINAIRIYQKTDPYKAPQLFQLLSNSQKHLTQQLGWHLAASHPSPEMKEKIEERLTSAIDQNNLKSVYWPKMAEAIANNQLKNSYTVVRQGLFENNHVSYARAMQALDPSQATDDFMDYLSLAPLEELRQLSLTTVDVFSCLEILRHFENFPPAISHPKFTHLFYYGISRNTALSEMSRKILEGYFPSENSVLAQMLARLPNWVQIAFVEGSRRQMSPKLSLFLKELKQSTSQKEVVEEIDHVVR